MTEPGQGCTHPWLRVTCGVCGEAVDALGEAGTEGAEPGGDPRRPSVTRIGAGDSQALFIVARGHPELLDQLRIVMGQSGVKIIEDRREQARDEVTEEKAREIRKRLREEGPADQS